MAHSNQDWEALGRNIQNIVDQAVNSHDFEKLNQTIRQVVGTAVDMGSEVVRKAVDTTSRPAAKPVYRQPKREVVVEQNLPVLYGSTGNKTAGGILKIVGGGLLSLVTLGGTIVSLVVSLVTGMGGISFLLPAAGFGGGALLITSGIRNLNWVNRFKKYRRILGQKTYCAVDKLARSVGKSVKFVRKELAQMIDKGLFLEGHLDQEGTQLITSHETYQYYEQSRLQLEQRRREEKHLEEPAKSTSYSPQVQEVLDKGNDFIAQIRRCNDVIPGEEISEKIYRIETLVQRIFDRVKTHPEIVPDLKKLMEYYLPMTVKLLGAYADMDAQPIQGQTIENSKREIEATLDTLNLAFEKLLDDLFADTALDVSSDISVLNTLLAQEGLTGDELSKMKKQQS